MQKNKQSTLHIVFVILMLMLASILHYYIRPALDDFYYMTFTDNGFAGYINNSVNHYLTLTGRAFVHFLLCPLLMYKMFPFKIWNTILILSLAIVIGLIGKNSRKLHFGSVVSAFSLFWLIGISVLADGALWGAGSFNYLFPVFMIFLYYYIFSVSLSGKGNFVVCILGFLSSATVEMTGLLAIFVVIYCAMTNIKEAKKKKTFVILNLASCIIGYITLFLSGGVSKRLTQNEYESIGIIERGLTNFTLFSRRICSSEGLSVILIITFLFILIYMLKQRRKTLASFAVANIVLLIFTGFNIIYDSRLICIISLFAFLTLCLTATEIFQKGNKHIMFFMICITISLGVCMISPVVAYRMLMPTATFLVAMCVLIIDLCDFSERSIIAVTCILTILASITMIFYIGKFKANAKIIDENIWVTENYNQGEVLSLKQVPDERYINGTVPSPDNFGNSYLKKNNIFGDINFVIEEPTAKEIIYEGEKLSSFAIMRNGIYYIPIRVARQVAGAEISWLLACAHVEAGDKTYRFCSGARAADTDMFFSPSIKLSHPVRLINGITYISTSDFNRIFETELEIK